MQVVMKSLGEIHPLQYLFKKWAKEPKCLCKIKEKRVKG